jgi:hypothetical protein
MTTIAGTNVSCLKWQHVFLKKIFKVIFLHILLIMSLFMARLVLTSRMKRVASRSEAIGRKQTLAGESLLRSGQKQVGEPKIGEHAQ